MQNQREILSAATMRSLPIPNDLQFRAFADHLIRVHSWYKHLPLFGGEFVVFLAPDAGAVYPLYHPRLPSTMPPATNTPEGYRRDFGHLDYIWRSHSSEPFDGDGRW